MRLRRRKNQFERETGRLVRAGRDALVEAEWTFVGELLGINVLIFKKTSQGIAGNSGRSFAAA
jgi:hypothetical protein